MQLHKAPLGLLEVFRLRTLGRNPDTFSETVIGVTDVTNFYGADLLATVAETGTPAAIGTGFATVASQFSRRYIAIHGQITIGAAAGTQVSVSLGFFIGNTPGVFVALATESIVPPLIGGVYRCVAPLGPGGLVLPPGHQLGVNVTGDAGGADHTAGVRYAFQRLDGQ